MAVDATGVRAALRAPVTKPRRLAKHRRGRETGSTNGSVVLAVIGEHSASLLQVARRHSLCTDDAQDAYQRALEIFIKRVDSLDPDGMVGWLHTVVKHEAYAIRASRQRVLGSTDLDAELDRGPIAPG